MVSSTSAVGTAPHIELHRQPGSTAVTSWPVTFGVPFRQGDLTPNTLLGVVNDSGQVIPSQVERVATWDDGSVRWLRVSFVQPFDPGRKYFLRELQTPPTPLSDDIVITQNAGAITLSSKSVRFEFGQDAFPERIYLDRNANGIFDPNEVLSDQPQGAFYARFIDGHRGTMRQVSTSIETPATAAAGPVRYAVIKVQGNYLDDQTGAVLAAGIVYYHFYAGESRFRMDHKFVFTQHGSGVNEIGIRVPVNVGTSAATVEDSHGQPLSLNPNPGPVSMVQADYPRFNETSALCRIREQSALVQTGDKCGSWVDLYGYDGQATKWGIAAQVAGFAEQFPKAFEIGQRYIQIELWSTKEGAPALNFNTADLFTNYFGRWMNSAPPEWSNLKSANGGVGKTHEIWLYLHTGDLAELNPAATLGATTEPPMTYADLDHVADSGVFGPLERRIAGQYDATENSITDYFDRNVFVSRRVFPPNGFLLYGMHPYVGQGWDANPWRPNVSAGRHESRLSWSFDYDLRRALFPLWVRTGDRRFYDYARPHARFSHDMQFSNAAAGIKPKGWIVLGAEDPPMLWGAFGQNRNLNIKPTTRFYNEQSDLAFAGSDDMAQLTQAYFLTADFHARDMVENWKAAVVTEIADPVNPLDAAEVVAGERPEAFIRMLSAAYDLNRDAWLKNFGDSVLALLRPANPTFDNFITKANYAKAADVFPAYYDYYLATGSQIAKNILLDRAAFGLRFGFRDRSFTRHDVDLLLSGSIAATEGGDRLQGAHLRRVLETYGRRRLRLADDLHMNVTDFSQSSTQDWQQTIMTTQSGRSFGLPAIMQGIRKAPSYYPSGIPITMIEPTDPVAITFEHVGGSPTTFEFSVNTDSGDLPPIGVVNVATLQQQNVVVQTTYSKRLTLAETANGDTPWYLQTGFVASLTITVPISAPSGQYRLTLGEHIKWRLLDYSAGKLVIEAPRGLPLVGFEDYYFQAVGTGSLPIYAYRPVDVYTADGTPVTLQLRAGTVQPDGSHRDGLYKIDVVSGTVYRIRSVQTLFEPIGVDGVKDNIIRLEDDSKARPVFAVGTANALFAPSQFFDLSTTYQTVGAVAGCSNIGCSTPLVPGRDGTGGAYHFFDKMAQTPPVAVAGQLERGSVSFWMRPQWEASRRAFGNSLYTTLFQLGPAESPLMKLYYRAANDAEGNGTLKRAYLEFRVPPTVVSGNGGDPISVPVRHWLIGGRWYHIAVVWDLDGQSSNGTSKVDIYIDGQLKVQYALINPEATRAAATVVLPAQPVPIRFGSDRENAEHLGYGTTLDDVRLYRDVCYTGDVLTPVVSPSCTTPMFYATFDDPANRLNATLDGQPIVLTVP
jgi:hypothetical protein